MIPLLFSGTIGQDALFGMQSCTTKQMLRHLSTQKQCERFVAYYTQEVKPLQTNIRKNGQGFCISLHGTWSWSSSDAIQTPLFCEENRVTCACPVTATEEHATRNNHVMQDITCSDRTDQEHEACAEIREAVNSKRRTWQTVYQIRSAIDQVKLAASCCLKS